MKLKVALAGAAALALAVTPILAQTAKQGGKEAGAAAQTFVSKAANGGMFEVKSSEVAVEKAKRAEVKDFARKMIDDHGKANSELKSVADKIGANVPTKLDPKHQAMFDRVRDASAAQFDRVYVDAQVETHNEAVTLFRDYSKSGDNAELKSFASKTLPVLEKHQTEAKALDKGAAATGTGAGEGGTSGKK